MLRKTEKIIFTKKTKIENLKKNIKLFERN